VDGVAAGQQQALRVAVAAHGLRQPAERQAEPDLPRDDRHRREREHHDQERLGRHDVADAERVHDQARGRVREDECDQHRLGPPVARQGEQHQAGADQEQRVERRLDTALARGEPAAAAAPRRLEQIFESIPRSHDSDPCD
jgi:hypothetical protein